MLPSADPAFPPPGPSPKSRFKALPDRLFRWVLCVSALLALLGEPGQAQQLPRPLNLGSQGGALLPRPQSEDLAAHLRGLVTIDNLPQGVPQLGAQLALSVSLWRWGEVGAHLAVAPRNGRTNIELNPGPLTVWGRLSPPLLGRLHLAAQLDYAAAPAPLDGGGRLFPDASTFAALLGYDGGRLQLAFQGAAQLADGHRYRGAQAGAGLWVVLVQSLGLTVGVEALGRAGQLAGEEGARTGWTVALSVGTLDEWGFRGAAAYSIGDGTQMPATSLIMQMGASWGPPFKRDHGDVPALAIQETVDAWWQRRQAAAAAADAGPPVSLPGALQGPAPGAGPPGALQGPCNLPITLLWSRTCLAAWSAGDLAPDLVRQWPTEAPPPSPPTGPTLAPPSLSTPAPGIAQTGPGRPPPRPPRAGTRRGVPEQLDLPMPPRPTSIRAEGTPPPPPPRLPPSAPEAPAYHVEPGPPGSWAPIFTPRPTAEPEPVAEHAPPAPPTRTPRLHIPRAAEEEVTARATDAQGKVRCTTCGVETTEPTPRTRGSKVDPRERQIDHEKPLAKGGSNDVENLNIKCATCNNRKGAKYPWTPPLPPPPSITR